MDGITIENIKAKRKEDQELNAFLKTKEKISKDLEILNQILDQTPVIGFNTGNYDINLIKNELFSAIGTGRISSIRHSIANFVARHISDEDYERVKFVWDHYCMKTLKDLLIWYNNLDVGPFIKAIQKQRELFKRFDLDMFADGVSHPGLSEKVMYKTQELIFPTKEAGSPFDFPEKRYLGYIKQDEDANREFSMTMQHLDELLKKQKFMCNYCYCKLNEETVSADRIDNKKGHEDGNIIISCVNCNVARKDMNIKAFRYKKLLEFNADRLVYSIDNEESEIYRKMKANIAGGPSIIFNRFAKRNETLIRGGKLCKKVIGYDANALYLWCLGDFMPCGRLTTIEPYDSIIDDIQADKIFGFLECDIETLEHLKEYFSEMTPIFKNTEIEPTEEIIGKHMFDYNQSRGKKNMAKKSRKLIGSYFGKKILIYTPLLKWYLAHGMVITKTYSFIKANAHKPFESFMNQVSDARRSGDETIKMVSTIIKEKASPEMDDLETEMAKLQADPTKFDKDVINSFISKYANTPLVGLLCKLKSLSESSDSKSMIANMMKLVGYAVFGRSGMDMTKHKEFNDGTVEMVKSKRRIKLKNPIQLSIAIYQLAMLRMLQFYYDCIDFYFDRSDFQYQEMDTDSGYIAFSHETPFPDLIKTELLEHYEQHKYEWLPRDDTTENAAFDRDTGFIQGRVSMQCYGQS
ncbi:unnamed protein product [Phytophthora lilii]|uniref:Unnamed protein product n=1 Tax=Phytophthora lilii TaxID=2077276 RepID=A0A9W6TZ08_9STRA|nr:unnamed protein product [Phytophthora lilii]